MSENITADATEFGAHLRAGGWRLALLVARSVERGQGDGGAGHRETSKKSVARATVKISAREFAKLAGTSADRVLRYLDAWENAARAEFVPFAADLSPGQEVELPDAGDWGKFYPPHPRVGTTDAEREVIAAQAERDGLSAAQVIRTASNPRAIESAIKASPAAAAAAQRALAERPQLVREHLKERRAAERAEREQRGGTDDRELANVIQHLADAERFEQMLTRLVEQVRAGLFDRMPPDVRNEAREQFLRWQNTIGWLVAIVEGGSITDEALERWLR